MAEEVEPESNATNSQLFLRAIEFKYSQGINQRSRPTYTEAKPAKNVENVPRQPKVTGGKKKKKRKISRPKEAEPKTGGKLKRSVENVTNLPVDHHENTVEKSPPSKSSSEVDEEPKPVEEPVKLLEVNVNNTEVKIPRKRKPKLSSAIRTVTFIPVAALTAQRHPTPIVPEKLVGAKKRKLSTPQRREVECSEAVDVSISSSGVADCTVVLEKLKFDNAFVPLKKFCLIDYNLTSCPFLTVEMERSLVCFTRALERAKLSVSPSFAISAASKLAPGCPFDAKWWRIFRDVHGLGDPERKCSSPCT